MKKGLLTFSTILILTASFSLISCVFLLQQNLEKVLTLWGQSMQMTVYLAEDVSHENINEIATRLHENDQISSLQFVSKEMAIKSFQDQMSSFAPELLKDPELQKAIPASYQFSLSKKVPIENQVAVMQNLADQLKFQNGVAEVSYGQDWVQSFTKVAGTLNGFGALLVMLIVACASFVVSNSLKSSIHQRREEIEVLELIGATSRFIRRPFLIEAMLLSITSTVLGLCSAYGLFVLIRWGLQSQLAFLRIADQLQFLSFSHLALMLGGAVMLGVVATSLCLHSVNDGWAASRRSRSER